MNTTLVEFEANVPADSETVPSLDQSLAELKSCRRLQQVTASIESFLLSQVARISESLERCQQAVSQNQILQRILADFEKQKADWEEQRNAESKRLYEAGEKLIRGWEQLEAERREWTAKSNAATDQ